MKRIRLLLRLAEEYRAKTILLARVFRPCKVGLGVIEEPGISNRLEKLRGQEMTINIVGCADQISRVIVRSSAGEGDAGRSIVEGERQDAARRLPHRHRTEL